MKKFISTLAVLSAITGFSQTASEVRTVGDFHGLDISAPIVVEITQGDVNSVILEGDANETKNISTSVDNNGVLNISGHGDDVKAKITVKKINSIQLSGASDTKCMNPLVTDTLSVTGSGASDAKINVQSNAVRATLSGASDVKFIGTTKNLTAVVSGAGTLKAYDLAADNVHVAATGASSAHVTANVSLDATSSDASDIHYQGNATAKVVNASGASSISVRGDDNNSNDTTSFHIGDYDVHLTPHDGDERSVREKKNEDKDFKYWQGIDLGVDGYLTSANKLELPTGLEYMNLNYAKSYVFGWNLMQKNIHIYRNNVNLGTGLGLTWYHYNFRGSYSLVPNSSYTTAISDSLHYLKNRLNMCYVNVPLFLEFNTNNNDASRSFHFGAGMDFGYNIFNNKLKQKYELGGHDYKREQRDDYNVNPFRYDIIARVGYGKFTIFGSYALSPLFEKSKGPVVYPFSAGIALDF
ncbi:MAG: DUF2807 domain-containing protein [Bacteroidetes bacterium]|nr:DUF2807 domain-containing protein [Bacteroidota bacterium]